MNKYNSIIDNKEVSTNNYTKIISPVTLENIGEVTELTAQDINKAYESSYKAFQSWQSSKIKDRINLLNKWCELIVANQDKIAKSMTYEIAKNYKSCLSEISRSVDYIEQTINHFHTLNPQGFDGNLDNKNKLAIFKRKPLGVILCISPFNYPINLSISKIAPALLTGNTVVFKPATQSAICSYMLIKLLVDAGLKPGVLNFVTGQGKIISEPLTSNKYIKLINYTGSSKIGHFIKKHAPFCRFIFELGGNDTAIVLSDADLEKTANQIVSGAFSYNGQRCTAIKRVIVEDSIHDNLVKSIYDKVTKLSIGKPLENKDITPIINISSTNYIVDLVNNAKNNNAKLWNYKKINKNIITPTLITNVKETSKIFTKEQFGPVLPIIKVKNGDYKKIIKIANDSEYGLQASLFSQDIDKLISLADQLEVGSVNLNSSSQRGPDYFPFLGIKNSGIGTQGIMNSLLACTRLHGIVFNYSDKIN